MSEAPRMDEAEVLELLEEHGAVQHGHFKLSSGRHSDLFAQKFRVLEHPHLTQGLGAEIARRFEGRFDLVASPAVGALVLGFAAALGGGTRFIFCERVDGDMTFRRGFEISPGERVLIVEDVVTTGGSAREVVDLVAERGGEVVAVAALVDRADAARGDLGAPLHALVTLKASSWDADACPLCDAGKPLTDPGSRRLA